jgi:mannitol-1-phosphate 5-dehydrogenase
VRGIPARDTAAVADALARADLAATAVGLKALPHVLPLVAAGLLQRQRDGGGPLDLILAENIHGAAAMCRRELAPRLPAGFDLDRRLGLVETSIGKMVPVMRAEDLAIDPLWVFAEAYNELIVDGRGFLNPLPMAPGLKPVDDIRAWVERKLYIHNLGHAAAAYLGYAARPEACLLADALAAPGVLEGARAAMTQSAAALARAFPAAFSPSDLAEHIEDLLARFANRALGDTVYRVGSDLSRKLAREDRIAGPMLLCARHGLALEAIARVWRAALTFRPLDAAGRPHPGDAALLAELAPLGPQAALARLARLDPADPIDARVIDACLADAPAEPPAR